MAEKNNGGNTYQGKHDDVYECVKEREKGANEREKHCLLNDFTCSKHLLSMRQSLLPNQ